MNTMTHGLVLAAILGIAPEMAVGGERKDAEITCEPTEERLVYDCTVMVSKRRSGDPVTDAEFTVGADMPMSMPGGPQRQAGSGDPWRRAGPLWRAHPSRNAWRMGSEARLHEAGP